MEVLMFTRYPVPGKAKTRMIPALGAEGAAELHRRLAEHSADVLVQYLAEPPSAARVCHTGADETAFREWLPPSLAFEPQVEGDLGARLHHALESSQRRGHEKRLVIGSDCPELGLRHLQEASTALDEVPLVLGPAADGGYYLLGLRGGTPASLFDHIDWGGSEVLQQTLHAAERLGLQWRQLETLPDVDHPDDLEVAARAGLWT